jgi:hypothetical protein
VRDGGWWFEFRTLDRDDGLSFFQVIWRFDDGYLSLFSLFFLTLFSLGFFSFSRGSISSIIAVQFPETLYIKLYIQHASNDCFSNLLIYRRPFEHPCL